MAHACRDGNGKAKAQLDLDLVKGNKKGYYKYTGNKRKTRETVRLRLSGAQDLGRKQMEMSEVLHTFFASVFTGKVCPQASQISNSSGRDWESDPLLTGKVD